MNKNNKKTIINPYLVLLLVIVLFCIIFITFRTVANLYFYEPISSIFALAIAMLYLSSSVNTMRKINVPVKLINKGKYKDALKMLDELKLISSKTTSKQPIYVDYNKAVCYNRMGDFKTSQDILSSINFEILSPLLKSNCYVLYSINLILLGEYIGAAIDYLEKSPAVFDALLKYNLLLRSYAYLLIDEPEKSDKLYESYKNITITKKHYLKFGNEFLFMKYNTASSNIFMSIFEGLYFLKKNQLDKAIEFLNISASCPYENYYSNEAKRLLKILEINNM